MHVPCGYSRPPTSECQCNSRTAARLSSMTQPKRSAAAAASAGGAGKQAVVTCAAKAPAAAPAAAPVAAAVAAAAAAPPQAAASRVLFVGGLPATTPARALQQQLLEACVAAGCQPTRVQVMPFESDKQRSRFAEGWLHKGFALLSFQQESCVAAAAAAVAALPAPWAATATLGPARKVPGDWGADLTYTPAELAAMQQQQEALQQRREHNRRQRQRRAQQVADSVEQLLTGLQRPFGLAAQQLYVPLLSQEACAVLLQQQPTAAALAGGKGNDPCSDYQQQHLQQHGLQQPAAAAAVAGAAAAGGKGDGPCSGHQHSCVSLLQNWPINWPNLQATLQQQQQQQQHQQQQQQQQQQHEQQQQPVAAVAGPIQLATAAASLPGGVEASLLFDWSKVPAAVDPAFGGQLADADVVRAGRGRMNLRALRKRVQVESFALLLWQLLLQREANAPSQPAASSSSNANTGASKSSGSSAGSSGVPLHSTPQQARLHAVEFGSGSGNLVLPLAHLFPQLHFTAVDMRPSAVQLLQQRVVEAGLANVTAQLGRIEEYTGPADIVLALHACGSATDWALSQAAARKASFIISPCCIGKINRDTSSCSFCSRSRHRNSSSDATAASGQDIAEDSKTSLRQQQLHKQQRKKQLPRFPGASRGLQYPRSQQLRQQMADMARTLQQQQQQQQGEPGSVLLEKLQAAVRHSGTTDSSNSSSLKEEATSRELFAQLASSADYSHQEDHSYAELAGIAKTNVELDRGMRMQESGYRVALMRLLQPELTTKSDVLVGSSIAGGFGWRPCRGFE